MVHESATDAAGKEFTRLGAADSYEIVWDSDSNSTVTLSGYRPYLPPSRLRATPSPARLEHVRTLYQDGGITAVMQGLSIGQRQAYRLVKRAHGEPSS